MKYPNLLERFLTYVKINTRSDETSETTPSTQSQVDFAQNVLIPEMKRIGLRNVRYLPNGFAVGTLPANDPELTRKIGFISHVDTADFNADNIRPQIVDDYDGSAISLGSSGYELNSKDFPQLSDYMGQTLITTDGTTLLGADDKSGIAEIMTALEFLTAHPDIKHCEIRVGFGPDEEIGIGADKFDAEDFDVDFAYTVDGGPLGELQYETFSAAGASLEFIGRNVHPGTAKGSMINALQLAMDFHAQLPTTERPELTEGYEGFYHLMKVEGSVDHATANYIIRDFEETDFQARKLQMQAIADKMNASFETDRVILSMHDQYYNMKQIIEKDMTPVKLAETVMKSLGIQPIIEPVRGGTDGSKISFMGIPTPNLFAGGENMHGRFEFVSLETMEKAVDLIVGIVSYRD